MIATLLKMLKISMLMYVCSFWEYSNSHSLNHSSNNQSICGFSAFRLSKFDTETPALSTAKYSYIYIYIFKEFLKISHLKYMLENMKNLYFSVSLLQKQFWLCLIKWCSWAVRVLFLRFWEKKVRLNTW